MPANTVNALSASQVALLSSAQVNSLSYSPYYSSFSNVVTSSLKSTAGATVTATTSYANFNSISLTSVVMGLVMSIILFV